MSFKNLRLKPPVSYFIPNFKKFEKRTYLLVLCNVLKVIIEKEMYCKSVTKEFIV